MNTKWYNTKLGDICEIVIGGTPAREQAAYWATSGAEGYPWVSIKDLNQGRIISYTSERITEQGAKNSNVKLVPRGTLLLSFKLTIGRIAFAGMDLYTNEAIAALTNCVVDKDFLYYGLQEWDLLAGVDQAIKGATLNKQKLKEIHVKVPASLEEQKRIAHTLHRVDTAIEQTESLIIKYGRIRSGLMQDLLARGIGEDGLLRSVDQPLAGSVYGGWKIYPLGELADVAAGVTLGKKLSGPGTVTLPYLRVFNVQDGYVDLSDIKSINIYSEDIGRYKLEPGDVLMNEGGDYDKLGRGAVWEGQIDPCLHQNHVFRVRTNRKRLLPHFLSLISSSPYGKQFFILSSKQSTNLASINSTQLKGFPIPCPPVEEQQQIIDIVSAHEYMIQQEQVLLQKLRRLKSGLMHDLLTGRVPVDALLEQSSSELLSTAMA